MNDNTLENGIKQYEVLRAEILQIIEISNNSLTFTITTVVAILSFAFVQASPFSSLFLLLPYVVIIPMSIRAINWQSGMMKLSAYMIVFLEDHLTDIHWESRNLEYVENFLSPTIGEKIYLIGQNIYLILSLMCYLLYVCYSLPILQSCRPLSLLNLCWPIIFPIFQLFITIKYTNGNAKRSKWVAIWKGIKTSEEILAVHKIKLNP